MNDEKFWNETYYKDLKKYNPDFLKDIWMNKYKEVICDIKNKDAIDLGCGLGQDTGWLIENKFNVISCDISTFALNKLKELFPNAKTMHLDVSTRLPFEDNSIGLVNANLSLHYFKMNKTKEIFDDIFRILEPGGLFIGRMNSDKNNYVNSYFQEIEENFYYDTLNKKYSRLFNKKQFDILTEKWNVIVLNEDETVRLERKKYTWEFILKK